MDFEKYNIKNLSLFGLTATCFDEQDLARCLCDAIRTGEQLVCFGYSLTLLPRFRVMPQIYKIAESCEIMVSDGKGFYHFCKLFGLPLRSDWAVYEVSDKLLDLAEHNGFSVLLLGSDMESNRLATDNLRGTYPNAKILEGHHGYFKEEDEAKVVEQINALNPDVLLIGISSPKKEEFVWRNRSRLKTKIIVLMGGVIDIYAGKTKPIPPVVKKLCLTWLYRFVQEPRRTRHILFNGLNVIFRLIPALAWARWIKKDKTFSIPAFYGVSVTGGCAESRE